MSQTRQKQQPITSTESLDLLAYLACLSSNTCIEVAVTPASSGETKTFSLHAGALQGMLKQQVSSTPTPLPTLVTLKAAATSLSLSKKTVRGLIDDGALMSVNVGRGKQKRSLRFKSQDIDEFIKKSTWLTGTR